MALLQRWFGRAPRRSEPVGRQASQPYRPRLEQLEERSLLSGGVPLPNHVVMVIEENHSLASIIGSAAAPYINALAAGPNAALFTQSFAVAHSSQINYLDLFSGSKQGVTNDKLPGNLPFTSANLGAELLAKGRTFVGYSEGLPYVGYTGTSSGAYVRRHNPWVNWQGAASNGIPSSDNQPFSSFPTGNYSSLPRVSIVVPNLNHDMHNGSITTGDTWLRNYLGGYIQWARTHNSLFILTFDEGDVDNHIPTLFVSPMVKHGQYSEYVNHFSVLRTIEDMCGLPYAGASAAVAPITDVW
jgi:hypothetical protein